jgi:phosphate starvation-inducible PhoH-like protein
LRLQACQHPRDACALTSGSPIWRFPDNRLLIELCGEFDRNLAQIEHLLSVHILRRGNEIALLGDARAEAAEVVQALYDRLEAGKSIEPAISTPPSAWAAAEETGARDGDQMEMFGAGKLEIKTRKKTVEPRTEAQGLCAQPVRSHELAFGIGPAGTGKTYLAVAVA